MGTDGDYADLKATGFFYEGESPLDTYYWNNSTQTNTWSEGLLNKTNLNTNFINNIGLVWANKIAMTTWKVGGNTEENIISVTPPVAYQNEIVNPIANITYSAKIGLMYVSDYYYAASPSAWTLVGYNSSDRTKDFRNATSNNWLYMGFYDWAISYTSDNSNLAFRVGAHGQVDTFEVNGGYGVRPSFNLESSITYVSGSGSMSDPIVIN